MKFSTFAIAALVMGLGFTLLLRCGDWEMRSPDVVVLDANSGTILPLRADEWRQTVVGVNRNRRTFKTMTRGKDAFLIKKYDFSGRLTNRFKVPFFTETYCADTSYALSPDETCLVYKEGKTNNLYKYNIIAGREELLWEDFVKSDSELRKVAWISDSSVLLIFQKGSHSKRQKNEIVALDLHSGEVKVIFNPINPDMLSYRLSPDTSVLAYTEHTKESSGRIHLLNLKSETFFEVIGTGTNLVGNTCWSPEGSELAYTEGRELKIFNLAEKRSRTIYNFPDGFICHYVLFGNGIVGYVSAQGLNDPTPQRVVFLDSKSGAEIRAIQVNIHGKQRLLDAEANTFVCEVE